MEITITMTDQLRDAYMTGFWLPIGIGLSAMAIWIVLRIKRS